MKVIKIIFTIFLFNISSLYSNEPSFNEWLVEFKKHSLNNGISEKTFNIVMKDAKFLPKVIEYDRYQPEFYEDTKTYVSKRSNKSKVNSGITIYKSNKKLINNVEQKFKVEKELLLALMGIETNYGTYVGKMDIISSLATLSFDRRRSEFFTKELLTVLTLVEKKIINHEILFGSWAGAFGFFQFMPSTIDRYAIDFNQNNIIELKNNEDAFASAANYLSKIGWKKNQPCFVKIKLKDNIPDKYLNSSARKIKNKKKLKFFKNYISNLNVDYNENLKVGIITPDLDIVENPNKLSPAYIVFENYEKVLKWNRSLRFALAVCTLKDKIKNEI
ncbi:lytic murein transglycosylase [Pelagibacterales bacterium SAG-MED15]|nr:lytic murein transglycosylase [Pelagibacterales bacterium SAG-MED15]